MHRIFKYESPETTTIRTPTLYQIVGFGNHLGHVLNVEMADVRTNNVLISTPPGLQLRLNAQALTDGASFVARVDTGAAF